MIEHDIVIIGGGPAGLAAAVAAYDRGVKDVVILDREEKPGGILRQCIHNGFGLHKLGKELTGPEYAAHFAAEVKKRGIRTVSETMVTGLSPDLVVTATNTRGILKIRAKAVILAMGCRERPRGALNICGTRPAGIYSAGTAQKLVNCEGYLVGKRVVILGSGDIGLIMARRMTLEGAKVSAVCEILPYSGGLKRNIVQCLEDYDIPLYLSTTVCEIHGSERLEGVTIAKVDEKRQPIPETRRYIPCDTLLLSCGLIPENELTRGAGVEIDPRTRGASVDQYRETSIPGVYACGNVLQVHDLVDFVSDEAEIAGRAAADRVLGKTAGGRILKTAPGSGVRYVLPQKIRPDGEAVDLFMRVDRPYGKIRLTARCGDTVLVSAARPVASPGEMERIRIPAEKLAAAGETVSVSVEVLS